jgi:hypothetical protein
MDDIHMNNLTNNPQIEQSRKKLNNLISSVKDHKSKVEDDYTFDPEELFYNAEKYLRASSSYMSEAVNEYFDTLIQKYISEYHLLRRTLSENTDILKCNLYMESARHLENIIKEFIEVLLDPMEIQDGLKNHIRESMQKDISGSAKKNNFNSLYKVLYTGAPLPHFTQQEITWLKDEYKIILRNDVFIYDRKGKEINIEKIILKVICYRLKEKNYKFSDNVKNYCLGVPYNPEKHSNVPFEDYVTDFWKHIIETRDNIAHGKPYDLSVHGGYICLEAAEFVLLLGDCIISFLD